MIAGIAEKRPVEPVLDAIPGFAGAQVDSLLSDGPTNVTYLLQQAGVIAVGMANTLFGDFTNPDRALIEQAVAIARG